MKTITITYNDGSTKEHTSERKMTKTAVLALVKEALETKEVKEITIK